MPVVNVQILSGASREQKSAIVAEMTDTLVRVLGKDPDHIHVILQESTEENWGYSGMLTDDWKASRRTDSAS